MPRQRDQTIDREALPKRLQALPGIEDLRAAAGEIPAYLVGGAVRDLLLGVGQRPDLDVVVEGDVRAMADALGGELTEHDRFGTATVQAGELEVDLAQARAEASRVPCPR